MSIGNAFEMISSIIDYNTDDDEHHNFRDLEEAFDLLHEVSKDFTDQQSDVLKLRGMTISDAFEEVFNYIENEFIDRFDSWHGKYTLNKCDKIQEAYIIVSEIGKEFSDRHEQ